ncbi:hypothetical protein PgNI_05976 [Pyricularia grisea]|uniref:Uncharacterized protein n=1 Tax=Pyricularia grisea TaxID=148305 RepID=A0A6P8B6T3_PYRGI|nr:hypothetical protein PgNI_05976 [Pyricularia grisea]TLD10973.1 hypothetical protein PgNI_05976 [Pyricularia grisea]
MWGAEIPSRLVVKGTSGPSKQKLVPKPSSCVRSNSGAREAARLPLFTLALRVGPTQKSPPRAMICQLSPGTPKVSHVKQFAPNTLSKPFRHGATISGLFFKSGGSTAMVGGYNKSGASQTVRTNHSTIKLVTYRRSTFDRADVMQGISSLTATL